MCTCTTLYFAFQFFAEHYSCKESDTVNIDISSMLNCIWPFKKALLSARAFHKRSQCEKPREKRQELRLKKEKERRWRGLQGNPMPESQRVTNATDLDCVRAGNKEVTPIREQKEDEAKWHIISENGSQRYLGARESWVLPTNNY